MQEKFLLFALCDLDAKSFGKPMLFDTLEVAHRYLVQFIDSQQLVKFKDRFNLKLLGFYYPVEGEINSENISDILITYDLIESDILKLKEKL